MIENETCLAFTEAYVSFLTELTALIFVLQCAQIE